MSYDPPVREKHKISEFVKTRGQVEDEPPTPKPEPPKEKTQKQEEAKPKAEEVKKDEPKVEVAKPLVSTGSDGKPDLGARPEKPKDEDNDRRPIPKQSPDYDP